MDNLSKYDVPWELITESLTGTLTVENEVRLQQWISADVSNKEKYQQIEEMWKNGFVDFKAYKEADENKSWNSLQLKMNRIETRINDKPLSKYRFSGNLIAIAAVFLGIITIGLWLFFSGNNSTVYETLANADRKVILSDGSIINLKPFTKIIVSKEFNNTNRSLVLLKGEANFEVIHNSSKPFTVKVGHTQIKDIGTSFVIRKGEKEISVTVTSGKVEFLKLRTSESRELTAGSKVTFDVESENFGEITTNKEINTSEKLRFDDTPLSEAIMSLQEVYKIKVLINDDRIANRKITAYLAGMPRDTAIKVICKTLGLEYSVINNVYTLKEKK